MKVNYLPPYLSLLETTGAIVTNITITEVWIPGLFYDFISLFTP